MSIDKKIGLIVNIFLIILAIFCLYKGYWMLVKLGYGKLYQPIIWISVGTALLLSTPK